MSEPQTVEQEDESAVKQRKRAQAKRLLELEQEGRVTPDTLIAEARQPGSPYHEEFNWNIDEAALEHWRDTARRLIREIKYDYITETINLSVSRYLRDPGVGGEQGYISVPQILTELDLVERALVHEFMGALAALQRACRYAQAFGISARTEKVIQATQALLNTTQRKAETIKQNGNGQHQAPPRRAAAKAKKKPKRRSRAA